MAKKEVESGFNRLLNPQITAADTKKKSEVKPESDAKKKPEKKADPKPQEKKENVVYSVRLDPGTIDFIKNYAYTKRLKDNQALEEIINKFKSDYEAKIGRAHV